MSDVKSSTKGKMLEKKIVLVDIDGTLNDFQNHFLEFLEKSGYHYDYSKCKEWHMERGIKTRDKKKILNSILSLDYFWETIPTLDYSFQGLQYLNDTYNVFIVTTPWNENNKKIKLSWMKKNFPFIDEKQIIFSNSKWELKGDIIIEDKPDTINKCNKSGFITITKFQPYNMDIKTNEFLYSWRDIKVVLDKVLITHQEEEW